MSGLSEDEREVLAAVTGRHGLLNDDIVCATCHAFGAVETLLANTRSQVAEEIAEALIDQGRTGWGGNAMWMTTGNKVGELAADFAREVGRGDG